MSIIPSPNMSLPIPSVGTEPGPQYASDVNNSLTIIDSHNHAPGSGVQIPSAGININANLPFNSFNATMLRSARFSSQSSPITASSPDIGCIYVSGADLYYNDTNGNQVRMTQGGAVSGATGTITGLPSGTASAAFVSGTGTFVFQQATSTGANLDVASIAIRYPGSYPTPSGNYIQLQAPASLATGFSITLPASLPGTTSFVTLASSGTLASTISTNGGITSGNIASGTITGTNIASSTITGSNIVNQTITQTQLANNSVGTAQLINASVTKIKLYPSNIAFSAASGTAIVTNTAAQFSNMGVGITATGTRPIRISIQANTNGSGSYFNNHPGNIGDSSYVQIYRDGSIITNQLIDGGNNSNNYSSVSSINFIDSSPSAGDHTYQIYGVMSPWHPGGTFTLENAILVAEEL